MGPLYKGPVGPSRPKVPLWDLSSKKVPSYGTLYIRVLWDLYARGPTGTLGRRGPIGTFPSGNNNKSRKRKEKQEMARKWHENVTFLKDLLTND